MSVDMIKVLQLQYIFSEEFCAAVGFLEEGSFSSKLSR